jgi:hypothetical protein
MYFRSESLFHVCITSVPSLSCINQIKCIKDGTDQLLVRDEEIKDRWREYFDKLFNGENVSRTLELDDSFDDTC